MRHHYLLLPILMLAGCSVHPVDPSPPNDVNVTGGYSVQTAQAVQRQPWYRDFNDTQLGALCEQALQNNYDVRQAAARLRQAEAAVGISEADRLPQVNIEASTNRRFARSDTRNVLQIGVGLSWERDFFYKLENGALADAREALATAEDLEALRLTLTGEVAEAYYGALAARQTLALLDEQVSLDRHYLELVALRFESGVGTSVEVLQQQGQAAQSESLIPTVRASLRQYENRLDRLLGAVPDGVDRTADAPLGTVAPRAVGIPSMLLQRRPDLRAQRHRLVAADARIAVAIADRLPNVTLGAGMYYSESFSYEGPLGLISTSLLQPLLDWGARKAAVTRNRALYEEALAAYGALYLQAIEEVENALYQERQQQDYLRRLEIHRDILARTVDETRERYVQGVGDYLDVISALEALHTVERTLIAARYDLILYRITLHRAVGSDVRFTPQEPA